MGNEVSKKYNLKDEHNATAGHCQLWKIYPGHVVHKDKVTTTDVSVWIFMREALAKREPIAVTDKSAQEQLMQIMKKDMSTLKEKDMHHPGIVRILEVAEDGRKGLAFVTERIVCSLADLLSRFEHIPGRYNWHTNYLESNATITDVEISHGFMQLAEALQFLHTVKKKLHMSVCPQNIVLTTRGEWKLCGLGFSLSFQGDDNKIAIPYYLNPVASKSILLEPDLRYMGQEMSEGGGTLRYAFASSDLFSLGVTMYETYRFNLQLARAGRSNAPVIDVSNNSVENHYHSAVKAVENLDYSMIPQGVQQILRGMLQLPPHGRIGNIDIINNPFFHSGALAIMRNISTITSKDVGGQASMLSSLPSQICDFPPRLLENFVLPVVCQLGVKDPTMWKYSLPLYVFISSKISPNAYARSAKASLIAGLKEKSNTDSLVAFVAHSEHFLEKMDRDFFTLHVVPMLCNALDKQGESSLQGSAITMLTKNIIADAVQPEQFLGEVVPKVCRETCKNPNFEVKLKGLYFLSLAAKRFEASYVTKNILPSLKHVLGQECTSDVIMAVLGVYNAVSPIIGADLLATNVLPVLTPILVNRALNRDQFQLAANRIAYFLQSLLTFRTNELSISQIKVYNDDSMKGNFFKEELTSKSSASIPLGPPPVPPNSGGFGLSNTSSSVSPGPGGQKSTSSTPPVPSTLPPPVPPKKPNTPPIPKASPPAIPKTAPPPAPPAAQSPSNSSESSSSSWFGFKKHNNPPHENSESASGGYVAPPVHTAPMSSPLAGGSGSSNTSNNSDDIDMDDFLSSFGKGPKSNAPSMQSPKISPPPPGPSSSGDIFGGANQFGNFGNSQGGGGNNIEDQIRNTQAEIARLSGSLGVQPNQSQQYQHHNYQQQHISTDMFSGSNSNSNFSGQSQQNDFFSPQSNFMNNSGSGAMNMAGGNFHSSTHNAGMSHANSQQFNGMGGYYSNQQGSYNAGSNSYRPPAPHINSNSGMNTSSNNTAKKDDPFDFFN